MARRYPILLALLPLLAACATSAPEHPAVDPAYLEGLSTEYSVRLEELQLDRLDKICKELPNAVVAGNSDLTVAATMFQCDGNITLDLIIHNHGAVDLKLDRSDIYVIDHMGTRLSPVDDWKGAENYGLRSKVGSVQEYVYLQGSTIASRSATPSDSGERGNSKSKLVRDRVAVVPDLETGGADYDMLLQPAERRSTVLNADHVLVGPGEKRAFWAYWSGAEIVYPLNAVVRMNGRRLIFRFEGANATPAAVVSESKGPAV